MPESPPPSPKRIFNIPLDQGRTADLYFPPDLGLEDLDFIMEHLQLWRRYMAIYRARLATEGAGHAPAS